MTPVDNTARTTRIAEPPSAAPDERAARRARQVREAQQRRRAKLKLIRDLERAGLDVRLVAFPPEVLAWLVQQGHVEGVDLDNPERSAEAIGIGVAEALGDNSTNVE